MSNEMQVAADYLEVGGFHEQASLLRCGGLQSLAFITGSRAYGTPREDSDVDLVCLMTYEESEDLRQLFPSELRIGREGNYPNGIAFRFGNLNLIVFSSELHYSAWRDATRELASRKPVTRSEAIRVIDAAIASSAKETKEVIL